jgi:hypothetical protein
MSAIKRLAARIAPGCHPSSRHRRSHLATAIQPSWPLACRRRRGRHRAGLRSCCTPGRAPRPWICGCRSAQRFFGVGGGSAIGSQAMSDRQRLRCGLASSLSAEEHGP